MRNALAGVERALFWTLVFAAFAATAAGLAARAVDRAAAAEENERRSYAVLNIVYPEGPAAMAAAEAALARSEHVRRAAPATPELMEAMLAQWGGGGVSAEEMPAFQLLEVEVIPAPNVDLSGELVAALAREGVTADVVQAPETASGGALLMRLRTAAFWGAISFALVMALIISLAARSLAARRRELVTVMADCGATSGQAAGRIADEAAVLGLYAGLIGGVLAGIAGFIVLVLVMPGVSAENLPRMILPIDLVPIAAAPLGAAIAAGAGARAAAGMFHRRAARLG
jgi:cell division transport system permease protein